MRHRIVHTIEELAAVGLALLAVIFVAAWIAEDFGFAAALLLIAVGPVLIVLPLAVILFEEFERSEQGGIR